MASLIQTVIDLLRLRAGPQDLPDHRFLTLFAITVYVAQGAMTADALGSQHEPTRTLLGVGLNFGAVAAILAWRRQPERLQQTLLAFAATGTVVNLLAFGFLLQADPTVNQPWLALVWFFMVGWHLAVDANIFRHALEVSLPIAMLITVMLLAISFMVLEFALR